MRVDKVPYHARIFPRYCPFKGFGGGTRKFVEYDEADMENENIPLVETVREHKSSDTDEDDSGHQLEVIDHCESYVMALSAEACVRENGWDMQDFKILRIWNISFIMKPPNHPFSVKCQSVSDKIELSICRHEVDEYESSLTKMKAVGFILDTQDCDKPLTVKSDDCEVSYSLFSNAVRVKLQMIPCCADRRIVPNVHGHVSAKLIMYGGRTYTMNLFEGEEKHKAPKHIDPDPTISSILILPRDYRLFILDISLMDTVGNFEVKESVRVFCRRTAIDQQHYIFGDEGYIKLRAVWGCLCADQEVCTCCVSGDVMGLEEPKISNTYSVEKGMSKKQ